MRLNWRKLLFILLIVCWSDFYLSVTQSAIIFYEWWQAEYSKGLFWSDVLQLVASQILWSRTLKWKWKWSKERDLFSKLPEKRSCQVSILSYFVAKEKWAHRRVKQRDIVIHWNPDCTTLNIIFARCATCTKLNLDWYNPMFTASRNMENPKKTSKAEGRGGYLRKFRFFKLFLLLAWGSYSAILRCDRLQPP